MIDATIWVTTLKIQLVIMIINVNNLLMFYFEMVHSR